jgi:hypothetical protein
VKSFVRVFAISLAFVAAGALAAVTVTETKGAAQLHATDGTSATYTDKPGATAHQQCLDAVAALYKGPAKLEAKCWDEWKVVAQADCADVKAPTIPLVKQTDPTTGAISWLEPDAEARPVAGSTTNEWETVQMLYVHNPAWPAGAPACWVRGLELPQLWRVNGTDPNAPFMERIEPGMTALEEGPLSVEPYYLPGEEPPPAVPPA